jgi:hypothetical protein
MSPGAAEVDGVPGQQRIAPRRQRLARRQRLHPRRQGRWRIGPGAHRLQRSHGDAGAQREGCRGNVGRGEDVFRQDEADRVGDDPPLRRDGRQAGHEARLCGGERDQGGPGPCAVAGHRAG